MQTIPTFPAFVTLSLILIALLLLGAVICLTVSVVKHNNALKQMRIDATESNINSLDNFTECSVRFTIQGKHNSDYHTQLAEQEQRICELEAILKIVNSMAKEQFKPAVAHPTPGNTPRKSDDIFSAWANIMSARAPAPTSASKPN